MTPHVTRPRRSKEETPSILRRVMPTSSPMITWLSQDREREERFTSAHILTRSTTPKTCATTAITEKEKPRWLLFAGILTGLTTPVECAKIVTSPNIT